MKYIGIDLGTSALKGLLVDIDGKIVKEASHSYPVYNPSNNFSEQNPADWINALNKTIKDLSQGIEDEIGGISFGGQMHGLVILDKNDKVIRPCILWNDGRTEKETEYLNTVIGKEKLSELTGNIAFAGFTAPKLLWLKANEPKNFEKICKIMLPKDYLVYYLTGQFVTDYSDASGTLFYDVKNQCWSKEMCDILSISENQLPRLCVGTENIGKVNSKFGLKNAIVCPGGGDNAAAAIGTGTIKDGNCNISLGTSGTIFIASDKFLMDKENSLHSFAHTNGKFSLMACILSAASCNKWWLESILGTNSYDDAVKGMEKLIGENHVFYLPYLSGERSPHNDVFARSCFVGMSSTTTKEIMSLAIIEGVTFALRDCLEIARNQGLKITTATLCGGGAKSKLWKKIIANVLNLEINVLETEQGPSFGAAILAMVSNNEFASIEEACKRIQRIKETIKPEPVLVEKYNDKYKVFHSIYPALKPIFKII